MDLAIALGIAFIVGVVLGWLGATHIHSVAKATTAATTVSGDQAAALNAKIDGLGTIIQQLAAKAGQAAVAAENAAAKPQG